MLSIYSDFRHQSSNWFSSHIIKIIGWSKSSSLSGEERALSWQLGRKGNMWATCLNGKHVSKSSLSSPHMWVLTLTHLPPSSPWAATQADKLPKLFNLFKRPSWHRFCNYFSRPAAITRVKLNINVSQDQPFSRGTVVRETLNICSRAMDFFWLKELCLL